MASVKGFIEIERPVEEVFGYAAQPEHRGEWQASVSAVEQASPGPVAAGTRVRETRRVTGGPREIEWEYTGFQPPSRWTFQGVNGPVRPVGAMTFSTLGAGGTRVELEIDFAGHGIGHLLTPLARRDARRQVPQDLAALKQHLEGEAPA